MQLSELIPVLQSLSLCDHVALEAKGIKQRGGAFEVCRLIATPQYIPLGAVDEYQSLALLSQLDMQVNRQDGGLLFFDFIEILSHQFLGVADRILKIRGGVDVAQEEHDAAIELDRWLRQFREDEQRRQEEQEREESLWR